MDMAVSEHMQKFSQLLDILACQQDKINNIYNTNNGVRFSFITKIAFY